MTPKRKYTRLPNEKRAEALALAGAGVPHDEIARRLDVSPVTVWRITSGRAPQLRARGNLPPETVQAIRLAARSCFGSERRRELAECYGLAPSTVSRIASGRLYASVPPSDEERAFERRMKEKTLRVLQIQAERFPHNPNFAREAAQLQAELCELTAREGVYAP